MEINENSQAMKVNVWKRIWTVVSVILLFFPLMFITLEMPTEEKLIKYWSQQIVWKTHEYAVQYQSLGPWSIRHQYNHLSDQALIQALQSKYTNIDYESINKKYQKKINNLIKDQISVVGEAFFAYLLVVSSLYSVGWVLAWIRQGFKQ